VSPAANSEASSEASSGQANQTADSAQNGSPTAVTAASAEEAELWNLLRHGTGYVVMLRHALAPGTGDPANFRLEDCTTQRNLSEAGRQQAAQIGAAFRQNQIPVDAVFSSQWCRCLETARLMDLGPVEPLPAINSFFQDRRTEPQQTERVRQLILDRRNTSGVTILVTHQVNITAISGIVPASGGMVVLRANGDTVETVGEITPIP
jgi:phosphohistidine phosphatase SixA